MKSRKIDILGTEYTIETHKFDEDRTLKDNDFAGYCSGFEHKIVVIDYDDDKYFKNNSAESREEMRKCTFRHEIVHAFFNESGLTDSTNTFSGPWCKNEEMIDWFATQLPKIFKTFEELELL